MTKKERDLVLGANRGPLLTNEPSTGVDLEKTESAGGMSLTSKPKGKEWLRRHWKRFWFVYFIGNIIFLAIILPILYVFSTFCIYEATNLSPASSLFSPQSRSWSSTSPISILSRHQCQSPGPIQ